MARKRTPRSLWIALLAVLALLLVACGQDADDTEEADPPADDTAEDVDDTAEDPAEDVEDPDEEPAAEDGETLQVAFFGFAQANSFAQATWGGVQDAAEANDAEATFFDGNFDAQAQIAQLQDATTSGQFDVFVIQANDGGAVVPAVEEAIEAGIVVVAEFTPIGTAYDTLEPQVDGMIFAGDVPTENGQVLGELGVEACGDRDPCRVAYLQGFQALPLDNARTEAVLAEFEAAPNVEVVATPEGGYTVDQGLQAGQDLLLAHPDVDVIIGSSQAIAGVEQALEQGNMSTDQVMLVGNGGSTQAVTAVQEGRWYATYFIPEREAGKVATELGLRKARGEDVETSFDTATLGPAAGTQDALEETTADYDD